MKAAQFVGKSQFELNDVDDPLCPPGGMVVRVHSAAICGTDLKIMKCQDVKMEKGKITTMEIPRITGHEFSGTIEEVGGDVKGFSCGDKVVVAPTVPCLECVACSRGYQEMCMEVSVIGYHRDGGFAELVGLAEDVQAAGCVVKVPDGVSLEAAALTEPLSCAVNCLELSPVTKGGCVLVMGAGPLGLMIGDLAHILGAGKVIVADISAAQLEKARASKAHVYIDLSAEDIEERVDDLTDGVGADLVVTACPAPESQQTALRVAARRGAVNFFGGLARDRSIVPLDTNLIHYKELSVTGTHGSAPKHFLNAIELQTKGRIDLATYVERTFPLQHINDALAAAQGTGRLKMLIKPNI